MLGRRELFALAAGAVAVPRLAWGQDKQQKGEAMSQATSGQTFFYASLGPALKLYRIDPEKASLTPVGTAMLPDRKSVV